MWQRAHLFSVAELLRLQPLLLRRSGSAHLDLIRAATARRVVRGHQRTLSFVDFEYAQHVSPTCPECKLVFSVSKDYPSAAESCYESDMSRDSTPTDGRYQ
jgi:hypothetical protein